jgi:hypothetical protein
MTSKHRKEESMANQEQYRAVLDDLLKQRNQLQYKISEIDAAVSALRKLMPEAEIVSHVARQVPLAISGGKYAGMSVRWGILQLLSEDAVGPMVTGQIAEALVMGGIRSDGKNFPGNVSAVLSDMNRIKQEVENTENGYVITSKGRSAWIHIKPMREAKLAELSSPIGPSQLSVQ